MYWTALLAISLPTAALVEASENGSTNLPIASSLDIASENSTETALQDLPDGDYYYFNGPLIYTDHANSPVNQSLILRKSGRTVLGIYLQNIDDDSCFSGVARQNTIQIITYGYQGYGEEDEPWRFSEVNSSIELNIFRNRTQSLPDNRLSILEYCVEGMRAAS